MSQPPFPPPPPVTQQQQQPSVVFPVVDVWENPNEYEIRYVLGSQTWHWIMNRCKTPLMHLEPNGAAALPSAQLATNMATSPPSSSGTTTNVTVTPRQRRPRATARRSKVQVPATLRMEVVDPTTQRVIVAWHGTSSAFEGLEDKDALVRTIQRCRVEELHLSPPSVLITWDVSLEECRNVVGPTLPTVSTNDAASDTFSSTTESYAVLKEPMGSQGQGIYFVRTVDEIHAIIDQHHQRARAEPARLESLIAAKNRIPSWVLQAEVNPCLLIRDGRKFHIRSYVVIIERPENDEVLDLYLYHQHEVRLAGVPVTPGDDGRNRFAHITNGALSDTTERTLMSNEPELAHLQSSLEVFIAQIFAKHLLQDISHRVPPAPQTIMRQSSSAQKQQVIPREFALAGLDLMVTTSGRRYLLEVNVNPGAPTEDMALRNDDTSFALHLETFWKSLINLVAGKSTEGFYDAFAVLEGAGITN